MKKTGRLATEVVQSILRELPLLKGRKVDVETIINSIPEDELQKLEVYQFIEFMKDYVMGIKVAFGAGDSGVAWELLADLLRRLELVGGINKKYSKHISEVSKSYKNKFKGVIFYKGKLEERKKEILKHARALKREIENDREKRKGEISKKKQNKGVVA